ncbi:MAG: hypothetical protein HYS87_00725 [Candidatus Colwellbacteria bacterium]|nr:hypothetical protein [Candidatus Colwellbacteria bacterium]
MKTKAIFVIAGLIAITVAGIYATDIQSLKQGERVIEFREDGFSPNELMIKLGESVTFVGKIDRAFWPASDMHPTHLKYPEFDPKEPLPPFGSWSFKFTQAGDWALHDHLAPYFTGVIHVKAESESSKSDPCAENSNSLDCSEKLILSTIRAKGLEPAFDLLARIYDQNPEFPGSCHTVTHNMGIVAYKNFLKDKDAVITPKTAFCASGFYHGFMEALLTANRDPIAAKEFCAYIDERLSVSAPDAALQCYHGIGHGAMDIAILSAVDKSEESLIEPALRLCEKTSDSEEQLYRCSSGIFNGIANFYITGEHGLSANKKNPAWVCDKQPDTYKESCYGNMNSVMLWAAGNEFSDAIKFVENIKNDLYAIPSARYLAGLAALKFSNNYDQAITACRATQERLYKSCIEGFAHGFLEHGTPGLEYKDAFSFCKAELMSLNEREVCFKYVLSNIHGWYAAEKAKNICESTEVNYKHYCKS